MMEVPLQAMPLPTMDDALKRQAPGLARMPSLAPSIMSHAATVACVKALNRQAGGKLLAWFMTVKGQMPAGTNLAQLMAGAMARIPPKSCGYFCASIMPCRPPVEQPLK